MSDEVRLEPFTAAHLDALGAAAADPDVRRYTRFPDPPDPAFPAAWLERYERGRTDGTREAFVIVDDATPAGAFLGLALAPHIDREAAEAELGYLVVAAARGRGVATRGVRLLTRWALDEQRLERLTLLIEAGNAASRRVAERCGYVPEGVLRHAYVKPGIRADTMVYARLRRDPEPAG